MGTKSLMIGSVVAAGIAFSAASMGKKDLQEKYAEMFLVEASGVLRTPPTDGVFGLSRLPTLHSRQYFSKDHPHERKVVEAQTALEKENFIALKAFGSFKDGKFGRTSTMSGIYQLNWEPLLRSNPNEFLTAESKFHSEVSPREALALYKSGKNSSRAEMSYVDRTAIVNLRAVFSSGAACMKCHSEVEKGKPIGILALIRVPKVAASVDKKGS